MTFNLNNISKTLGSSYVRVGMLHSFEQADVYQQANAYAGAPDAVPAAEVVGSAAD